MRVDAGRGELRGGRSEGGDVAAAGLAARAPDEDEERPATLSRHLGQPLRAAPLAPPSQRHVVSITDIISLILDVQSWV